MISGIRSWVTGQASCWPPRGWGFTPRSRSFTTPSPRRRSLRSGDSRGTRWVLASLTPSSSSTVSTSGAWTSLRQKSDPDLQWQLTSCSDLCRHCSMYPESCRIQSMGSLPSHAEEASITHSLQILFIQFSKSIRVLHSAVQYLCHHIHTVKQYLFARPIIWNKIVFFLPGILYLVGNHFLDI